MILNEQLFWKIDGASTILIALGSALSVFEEIHKKNKTTMK
jgi:hypothetical protein